MANKPFEVTFISAFRSILASLHEFLSGHPDSITSRAGTLFLCYFSVNMGMGFVAITCLEEAVIRRFTTSTASHLRKATLIDIGIRGLYPQ
jgi:hypothetical protein